MAYPDAMSFNHSSTSFSLLHSGNGKKTTPPTTSTFNYHLNTSYFCFQIPLFPLLSL